MGDYNGGAGRTQPKREWKQWTNEDKARFDAKHTPITMAFSESERDALSAYTGSNYENINDRLRKAGADFVADEYTWARYIDHNIRQIDYAFAHSNAVLTDDMVVYRNFGGINEEVKQLSVGQVVTDYGFVSTTINAKGIITELYEIRVPAGTRAIWARPISNWKNENEVILKRGTTMRVVDKKPNGDPVFEVIGQM